ncbi:hypothetical protein BBI01_22040 [Chryseobacterium artocarpi]|uniref:Uncharacterized protein n=2 Tax=Chryseobacterium artocarpi TaxID=1414727 RepID=A0A1B8ZYN9_9FLAO|nr:hypothetical protein BBI01_22040 [Chryseobacterium artocarpi]
MQYFVFSVVKNPIKNRTKNWEELKNMALEGINIYWSRTDKKTFNKGTDIHGEKWGIFVNAVQDENGMAAPKIIYFTNAKNTTFNRSHNWELHRELYYKTGYTYYSDWKSYNKNTIVYVTKGWFYSDPKESDLDFKETSAHEIGHQLLLTYGGRSYSYTHKSTSGPTWIQQDPLPGTKYPENTEEIDLMKYADEEIPVDYHDRVVLSKEDSLSIIWLSKIEILSLFFIFSCILSCSHKNAENNREIVNYYNGIVLDKNSITALPNVSVKCSLNNNVIKTVLTDKRGHFKISDSSLNTLNIQEQRKLIFYKEGYVSDTIYTTQRIPQYRQTKNLNSNHFIYKIPDTLYLQKIKFE